MYAEKIVRYLFDSCQEAPRPTMDWQRWYVVSGGRWATHLIHCIISILFTIQLSGWWWLPIIHHPPPCLRNSPLPPMKQRKYKLIVQREMQLGFVKEEQQSVHLHFTFMMTVNLFLTSLCSSELYHKFMSNIWLSVFYIVYLAYFVIKH